MRVLVTGGAGYIGSITAQALLDEGHEVVIIDNFSTGREELLPPKARVIRGDVGDRSALGEALDGPTDAVIHFAAKIEAGESMTSPEAFFANNTAETMQLLRAVVEAGVERFVFSSTAAVYGDPIRIPISEEDPTEPTNAYGETKLLVERALRWIGDLRGLRYACLRYFNAAGGTIDRGEMHQPETHLIPLILDVAVGKRKEAVIFGDDYPTPDGTCIRDFVHVSDLASAHLLALQALEGNNQIICNLGNGQGYSVKEVIDACRKVTGQEIPVRVAPRRPGDPPQLVASSDRAREILGWVPSTPALDDIVGSAWLWHSRNRRS